MAVRSFRRPWDEWVLTHAQAVGWAIFLTITLLAVGLFGLVSSLLTPAVTSMTTVHQLQYLPAKYELVKDVTNMFSHPEGLAGAAGGIAYPQIGMTREMYVKYGGDNLHFLAAVHGVERTVLNYYNFTQGVALYTSVSIDAPVYRLFEIPLGYYLSQQARIKDNNLVLYRTYRMSDSGLALLISVLFVGWFAAWTISTQKLKDYLYELRYR